MSHPSLILSFNGKKVGGLVQFAVKKKDDLLKSVANIIHFLILEPLPMLIILGNFFQKRRSIMKITLTSPQYSALMDIYGPPENIHLMIMKSTPKDNKWIIKGDNEDFEDLLSLIGEEIAMEMCTSTNAKRLLAICKKVDPSSLDYIGF